MNKFLLSAAALGTMAAFSAPASATLVTCPAAHIADGTSKVFNGSQTAVDACQYDDATGNSTVANLTNINISAFYGFSDWTDNGQTQINLADGAGGSGTWTINGVDFAAYDYMIVFKSGNSTHLTGFLFNEEFSSGGWSTPFTDPPFDLPGASTSKDVSHYSIVKRYNPETPPPVDVPEPAMLGLFGLGLMGLGMARRRRG
ncbi:PEP-CTERM sorting domain-containing protein [Sphingosinicella sp.]|jgi:hypothetical protein|uniref:PEP-CTERM sorting domain-containing protein n=1 Tax=Sphingosinicella sp. TaxID=1917971 RepID=UPI0017BEC3F8|nr:PEP-CTERM sorting domain-containing protein [Sphingosinicella sp.]MBA4758345.1 PEP-CTERM sorting domain-containing protein [Sphingosinicella sp.]MEA3540388.1 PEP-CTERM sorting domain-containing protein [Pseudomonadota bacterium]